MHRRCRCIYIRRLFGRSDPSSRLSETTPRVPHSPTFVLTRSPLQKNPLCAERRQQVPDPNPILCFASAPAAPWLTRQHQSNQVPGPPSRGKCLTPRSRPGAHDPHSAYKARHKTPWVQGIIRVGQPHERAARGEIEGARASSASGPIDDWVPVLSKRTRHARAGVNLQRLTAARSSEPSPPESCPQRKRRGPGPLEEPSPARLAALRLGWRGLTPRWPRSLRLGSASRSNIGSPNAQHKYPLQKIPHSPQNHAAKLGWSSGWRLPARAAGILALDSMSKHKRKAIPPGLQAWIQARGRHHLSHAHVQMARELGMNPKKLGSIDNHDQEPWKAPLPQFIEDLYLKRFGRERPEVVVSIEQRAREQEEKKAKKAARAAAAKTDVCG
jgi:hypothetical protein